MTNLKSKTKAELIEIIEYLGFQLDDVKAMKIAGTEDAILDFIKYLKQYLQGYQASMFSKHEVLNIINGVYNAFMFAKGVRKDEEN